MTEAIALVLLKMLLAEAPGVVLAILRSAGLVGDDAGHAIDKMKRASDVLITNPMTAMKRSREADAIREYVDANPAHSGSAKVELPPEYEDDP